MLQDDIHQVYLQAQHQGKESLHPAGRFLVHDGQVHHLEDYHGLLKDHVPEGVIDDYTLSKLSHPGPNMKIAGRRAIRGGHRLDVVPQAKLDPLPQPKEVQPAEIKQHVEVRPPSVFHYTRVGHDQPHVLEVAKGKHMLDGNPLSDHEVAAILDNVRTKTAKLRYAKGAPSVAKMEKYYSDLKKEEGEWDPQAALAHLSQLDPSEKTSNAVAALRRHVFEDPMTGLGNKYAHAQWLKAPRPGVHLALDANNFKSINDTYGHEAGDQAIKAYGNAIRDALNEVAPPGKEGGSAHRIGGDEFQAHLPTPHHAERFARALRSRLEAVPPLGGTHKLSMSVGTGADPRAADMALYQAKNQKMGHTVHTIPHVLYHSFIPGHEGPMMHEPVAPPAIPSAPPQPTA